ncbi:hypothetical protein OG453_27580 [Streptomyces sp. NBC_01381]|uniref:hypothetical protein n=1 Tax=Streptomyces sp. NBC_01381 TaxID=2903845 RepID=UPI002254C779|nr:hypothetical protein [Streptomyces sp. NBC_01381]MCX4670409.1 hypothetical protein [Streptomyces sp. NBC_01381]
MDLEALRSANFSLLDDAISDWTKMVDNLDRMEEAAGKGLKTAANKANWAGVNATVSKEFIGKTAEEFSDAHLQAKSIRDILRDTRDELKDYQRKLRTAIKNGLDKNLKVTTSGSGFTVRADSHPDSAAKGTTAPEPSEGDVTALRDEIQELLNKATESDSTASTALRAIADQSAVGFSGVDYSDRDEAADAIKKADELSKLAKKAPEDLSTAEFDRLNAGFKRFADDELFSQRFATNLGAKGTLEFWAGINTPDANPELNYARHEKFDDLQKNLSLTLATATQSDAIGMTEWTNRIIEMGDRRIGGGPMGFQVMSNLMRWGDYDDQFMTRYGTELIRTEKGLTGNGGNSRPAWQHTGGDPLLNRTESDSGWDPMTGFMKGLSNSPAAATDFFSDKFISKEEEGNPFERENIDGKKEAASLSNFQYLFEEREWPKEFDSSGEESDTGRNNLALALEAATTGHPAGEIPTVNTPAHNQEQAKLMESIVASVGEDSKRLTDHGFMSDSMGQIAAEYLPDINRSITDVSENNESIPKLFPISGTAATLEHADVTRFLVSVGQNPEGNASIEIGQKNYMANLMDYHLNPDLPGDRQYLHSSEESIREIARRSAEVGGTLAIGRQEAILGPAGSAGSDFDDSVSQKKNFWSGAVGTGIGVGVGVSFVASPVAGAAVGGAAGTVSSMVLEQLFKDAESDSLSKAGGEAAILWEDSKDKNTELSRIAAVEAAKAHGGKYADQVEGWAQSGTADGFNDASTSGRHMADDLTTEIQP